jgi:heme-degrading monooxygenase HmoA
MVVAISKFVVSNGMEREVTEAFINRPHKVESAPGFVRLEVFSPLENNSEFWLVTYWENQADFEHWHKNHRHESHEMIPKGIKLDPRGTELRIFRHIAS